MTGMLRDAEGTVVVFGHCLEVRAPFSDEMAHCLRSAIRSGPG